MTSKRIIRRETNRLLRELSLPEERAPATTLEEDLFMREYDIRTFGHRSDMNVYSIWRDKEQMKNQELASSFM